MRVVNLSVKDIDPDPNQPRQTIEEEPLAELAGSLCERGLLQPIVVTRHGKRMRLVDGHRRLAAAIRSGWTQIAAVVIDTPPDQEPLLLAQLAANCVRVDLSPIEKARSYQRLMKSQGWSQTELAERLHVSKSKVTRALSFLSLPGDAQRQIDSGELPESTAYAIARAADETTKRSLLEQAATGGLKRDAASARVRKKKAGAQRAHRTLLTLRCGDLTAALDEPAELEAVLACFKEGVRACRKALRDGLDLKTLQQVLRDQRHATARPLRQPSLNTKESL